MAGDLDLTETALREWVKRADIDTGNGPPGALTSDERAELAQLRRGQQAPANGARNPEKSGGLLREGEHMKFVFILAEEGLLPNHDAVPRSRGLSQRVHAWRKGPGASCSRRRTARGPGRCGPRAAARPTVARACMRNCGAQGIRVGQKRVERLMQENGLEARRKRRLQEDHRFETLEPDRAQRGRSEVRSRRSRSRLGHRRDCDLDSRGLAVSCRDAQLYSRRVLRARAENRQHLSRRSRRPSVASPCRCALGHSDPPTPATHTERSWPRTVWWRA